MHDDDEIGQSGSPSGASVRTPREAGNLVATLPMTSGPTLGDMPEASGLAAGSGEARSRQELGAASTMAAGSSMSGSGGPAGDQRSEAITR